MNYSKIKNGLRISVKKWDNKITLTDIMSGQIVSVEEFSDHIKAVALAKAL